MITKELFIRAHLEGRTPTKEDREKNRLEHIDGQAPTQNDLMLRLNLVKNELDTLRGLYKDDIKEIQEIRDVFRRKKYLKKDEKNINFQFANFAEFYGWYKDQAPRECFYCGIEEDKLRVLFEDEGGLTSKRRRGKTLEIERRDSTGNAYRKDNCVLACYFCNNHKSDIISEKDHMKYFADSIYRYLSDQHSKLVGS